MDTLRQIFNDYYSTSGAFLTCPARVNLFTQSPSVFSFVRCELNKLIPSSVRNRQGQRMIPDHAFDVQLLEKDCAIQRYKRMAELMGEVTATTLDALMDASRYLVSLLTLCSGESLLIRAKEAWIINLLARGKRTERSEANIYANGSTVLRQRLCLYFHREARIPLARCGASDGERLNLARQRAMQLDSHVSDFRQAQLAVCERETGLSVGERIVSFVRLESWKACFLFMLLNATKEALKSLVKSAKNILKDLAVNLFKFWTYLFDFRQLILLVNVADRFVFKSVGVSAFLQASIVEFAQQSKLSIQARSLSARRKQPILIGFELCYIFISHAVCAPTAKGLVRVGDSSQAIHQLVFYFSTNHSHQHKKIQPSAEGLRIHPRFEKCGLLRDFVKGH